MHSTSRVGSAGKERKALRLTRAPVHLRTLVSSEEAHEVVQLSVLHVRQEPWNAKTRVGA